MTPYTLLCADGSLSLLQVMEFHAKANPDHPLFRYDSPSTPEGYEDITWRQAVNLFDTTAQIIRGRLGAAVDRTPAPVVGILASTSSILYAFLLFGTLRAGCPVFPLSTRNSEAAIAHLITESGVNYLLVSQDAHMQNIARKANDILHSKNVHITLTSIPTYEEICAHDHEDRDALPPLQRIDDDQVLIIAHSSGFTSFPKVIPLTQKYCSRLPGPRLVDLSTRVQATHGAAMFRAAFFGVTISLFPPTANAVIATPDRVLASALSTKSTVILCPPMFLEHWVQDPASVEKLRTFTEVLFAGGPLARFVGDSLDKSGVTLIVAYGLVHVSLMLHNAVEAHGNGWEYFQFCLSLQPVLVPVDGDPTGLLFKLIVKQTETNCLVLPNTEVDGILAYDTNDILQRHPTAPTFYRNGEKTNPGPIEQILAQDSRVKAAIMFGRERPHAGVVIAPSQDVLDVEAFRNAIWPTVEQANATAPSHSRLFKDVCGSSAVESSHAYLWMIVLATPSRPFQVTAKGTPRRQAILEDYAEDIDAAYAAFNRVPAPAGPRVHGSISINDALEIVRGQVHINIRPSISDSENLFDAGADSLLAARIRRGIIQVLGGRVPEIVAKALPDDVVFTCPTIAQLASLVYGVGIAASAVTDKPDSTPFKNVPASILDNNDTIVRLREPAAREPPLILVHGGGGFIYGFLHLQKQFRTGLWAIQAVPETPRTSFVTQTDFYYKKIKEAQRTGPYRIGGYSAGAFMAFRIAKLLEEHGDTVIQLALIDSSPLLTLAPRTGNTHTAETDFADPETLRAHHDRGVHGHCATMRRYRDPWWSKFADCMWERWNGRMRAEEMSELMAAMYENMVGGSANAFEFALSLAGERRVYAEVMRGMIAWMGELKAPVTLYKASRGLVAGDWCCTNLRVVEVSGDHIDIVNRDELVEDLQNVCT
ncbi:hypothetical protein GGX14DRAFT_442668 [Mycena pura]|uniref:Carrier domain-containing protein n=1 Tax=Mycena pura TaxID=153505 RepID=A0AAD6VP91_9AGAR|nr:hypothetical protein GGX14DRAFT_442668 [Mycena pura]